MGATDWSELSDNALQANVPHGVINAAAIGGSPPGSGSSFVYAMNSAINSAAVVASYTTVSGFSPVAKGASISGAIQRCVSGGPSGWSVWLFAALQGGSSLFSAYALGLADGGTGAHIVLQRAPLSFGMADNAPGTANSGTLARGTATYPPGTWVQLMLEVVCNTNGDVVLNCYQNDLTVVDASVQTPTWAPVPGISQFIDDAVGANVSNLLAQNPQSPLAPGFVGWGMQSSQAARRAAISTVQIAAQL
jgi:hypothetical protein